ncbi:MULTISPECIES: lysis protein [unclassified Pseudomonas]|uniref:lysis protein n=1 Tax=unclassified Pseudomonas TaxID=196821 RepID=UPI000CD082FD|nr:MULTISPECIES: lysis protein [unclassified Pseudomonas]POA25653.1 lysis protein [Pseudomonas sp. FW305-3-2-15-E-TSA4]POA45048.1 lysis protein [Pseudomonas sp. FW305-3-2-15-E-TSA2]
MGALDQIVWPRSARIIAIVFACLLSALAGGGATAGFAFSYAKALGETDLANLKTEQAQQATKAANESRLLLLQQVARVNEAEALMYATIDQLAEEKRQLQERIPHVTTQYIPAPGAAAKPVPHCVFTAGWLRDYNAALGVPAPRSGAADPASEKTARPAPGTDAELLESGVTPADILAHAQDYGEWARTNLAQLNELLDLREKD